MCIRRVLICLVNNEHFGEKMIASSSQAIYIILIPKLYSMKLIYTFINIALIYVAKRRIHTYICIACMYMHEHTCMQILESSGIIIAVLRHDITIRKSCKKFCHWVRITFYQTYFYYKPSKYSPFPETHFCNILPSREKQLVSIGDTDK